MYLHFRIFILYYAQKISTCALIMCEIHSEKNVNSSIIVMHIFLSSPNYICSNLQWEKSDDKPAIAGLVFAGLIGLWASFGLINVR